MAKLMAVERRLINVKPSPEAYQIPDSLKAVLKKNPQWGLTPAVSGDKLKLKIINKKISAQFIHHRNDAKDVIAASLGKFDEAKSKFDISGTGIIDLSEQLILLRIVPLSSRWIRMTSSTAVPLSNEISKGHDRMLMILLSDIAVEGVWANTFGRVEMGDVGGGEYGQWAGCIEIGNHQQPVDEEQQKEIEMALDSGSGPLSPQNDVHVGATISVASDSSLTPIYIVGVTTTTTSPHSSEFPSTATFSASSVSPLSSPVPSTPIQQSFTASDALPLPSTHLSIPSTPNQQSFTDSNALPLPSTHLLQQNLHPHLYPHSHLQGHCTSVSGDGPNSDSSSSVDNNATADLTISSSDDSQPSLSFSSSTSTPPNEKANDIDAPFLRRLRKYWTY
ncbi:hypothetical protein K435DRAFT_858626 [Dendrothele bispora CBS 962.96]|uniref:Uncharacterized protein n=1 Tax=Dendrothele bispora (strain CBS 962.96) TaxID=1314807 RepID=A0A4S8M2R8_DENBC|nr:hypothetical protein K435DRAFT_858626 [Dendrothele bispora CBS 962.96]